MLYARYKRNFIKYLRGGPAGISASTDQMRRSRSLNLPVIMALLSVTFAATSLGHAQCSKSWYDKEFDSSERQLLYQWQPKSSKISSAANGSNHAAARPTKT